MVSRHTICHLMKKLKSKYIALLEEAQRQGQHDMHGLRLCFEILSLASTIDEDCANRLSPHHLTEGRFVILFLLFSARHGLAPHDLAIRAGVSRATITGLLDGLERDHLIERRADDKDRRMLTIHLTKNGATLAQKLFISHTQWIASLFSDLSSEEKHVLSTLMHRIWHRTDAAKKDSPLPP